MTHQRLDAAPDGQPSIPGTVLLSGIVGSQAYGLAHSGSDIDRLAVFAFGSDRFWQLVPPAAKDMTVVRHAPDYEAHEAFKFMWLCLRANPKTTELLWLDGYEVVHPLGEQLIGIRSAFLCANRVREAYCGYAQRQLVELCADLRAARVEKHARHMLRLLDQGLHLYETGQLQVALADPYRYMEFGQRVAAGDTDLAEQELEKFAWRFERARTPLPAQPDEARVAAWYSQVRRAFLPEPAAAS